MTIIPDHLRTPDPRYKIISLWNLPSEPERKEAARRQSDLWPHLRPNSCMVAAMGNHWVKGSWQRVVDMVQFTNDRGIACCLQELQDRCFNPYDALGTMRNEAANEARYAGFEWLLYVDCDVQPEPDTLVRLLQWEVPIVAPYIEETGTGKPLHGPHRQHNSGLKPIRWCVLSMLLFRVTVFNIFTGNFWADAMGADEGFHFKKLWLYGHRPYLDTTIPLRVSKQPTYPLSTNRMTWEERQNFWKAKLDGLAAPPDRRAIKPFDVRTVEGEYMPFSAPRTLNWGTDAKILDADSNGWHTGGTNGG